ncbi:MAG: PorT family protein [Bacteroidia bacterium]|nr:PorT family protein [Bacteroidia bacterium]
MKRTRKVIFGLLFLAATSVQAQKTSYLIGINGSATLEKLYGNSILKKHQYTPGYSGGLTLQVSLKKNFSFCTAINFEQKGSFVETSASGLIGNSTGNDKIHLRLSYITVPLMFRRTFGDNTKFFFNSGPFAACLLRYTLIAENNLGRTKTIASGLKPFDIGICAGVGMQFTFKKNFIVSLETRESLGLQNISSLPVINNGSIKTQFIQLIVGVSKFKKTASVTPRDF